MVDFAATVCHFFVTTGDVFCDCNSRDHGASSTAASTKQDVVVGCRESQQRELAWSRRGGVVLRLGGGVGERGMRPWQVPEMQGKRVCCARKKELWANPFFV